MRLIDADYARGRLISAGRAIKGTADSKRFTKLIGILVDRIDAAPTLDCVPRQQWISVKERLPDEGIDVLMRFEQNMAVGFRLECDWCAYTDDGYYTDCDSKPTHWMPLPEPPKEE